MVIRRGHAVWGSSPSSAECHLADDSPLAAANSNGPDVDSNEFWFGQQCPVVSNSNPQNQVKWKNTFHMRQMTLSNLSSTSGQVRQTLSAQAAGTKLQGRCMTSASKSLELLRLNIQSVINKEIDAVLKKYLDKFFKPAIENIRNNLGDASVTEDSIRLVCRQILEDAKMQYYTGSHSRGSSPYSDSETGSIGDSRFGHPSSRSPLLLFHNNKRKESDTDSEASQSMAKPRKKSARLVPNIISGVSTPVKVMKFDSIRREGPKWDPNRISKSTLFIMGARANKVLGFGQTRGRLYTKHPELLKYSGDAEDKEWLSRHNLMPPTGGIAYLLILEDVRELAESEEYRHNPNVLLGDLKGFEAPDFMLKKIRAFIAQARTDGKEQSSLSYFNDSNDVSGSGYSMDCASVIMTPPATVLDSAPGTPCEALDLVDCSTSLLSSGQAHDFLTSGPNNLMYDNVVYCDSNKPNQPFLYSSGSPGCGNNITGHPTLASLLATSIDNDNAHEKI